MKAALIIAATLLATPAYSADTLDSINGFCLAVRNANYNNIPGNPDSPLGRSMQRTQKPGDLTYEQMWNLAKSTGLYSCSQMW